MDREIWKCNFSIRYSSSKRESPERSLAYQKLFPDERDLGVMLSVAPYSTSAFNGLKLEGGLFSGNGIRQDDNGKLDFIGRLSYTRSNSYADGTSSYKSFNYMRSFFSGHAYFIQDIYKTPFTLVLKYGYLDPNTKMAGDEITEKTELFNHNYGFGLLWRATSNIRVQAFYELVKNELTSSIAVNGNADYSKNIADNLFTLRVQYKF